MEFNRQLPPAIVLGVDTPIGLTVVRELGERGVPVLGIAKNKRAVGLYSRWLKRAYLRPRSESALIGLLNDLGRQHERAILMTVAERDAALVRRAVDGGRLTTVRALVPSADKLRLVTDKMATYELARAVGLPVPRTWRPDRADLPPPVDLIYPCILKWADPNAVVQRLAEESLPLLKAEYCYDAGQIASALARYSRIGRFPLVQSFCPGVGHGHMLFMHQGRALLRFKHRRRAEWPPEGGTATVCDSLPLASEDALMDRSEALLQHIGWEGAAMVEYRLDPASGQAWFMEVNGRFWGSLPLAYHAGAPFAWLTYAVLGLGLQPALPSYRADIRCRFMIPETKRLFTLLFRPGTIQNRAFPLARGKAAWTYLTDFVRPRTRYYVFAWRDPLPFLADVVFTIASALTGLAARLGGGADSRLDKREAR